MTHRLRPILVAAAIAAGLAAVILGAPARAAWPPPKDDTGFDYTDPSNWPNDPGYAAQWDFWGFVPKRLAGQVDDRTKRLGTGGHYDRAFAKTRGDRRVRIAVLDSGAEWESPDLVNKWYLNADELPISSCPVTGNGAPHDVNGDGVFNVLDYTTATGTALPAFTAVCDPRITADVNKNGILDPEDLIAAFSDGKDDDGNGYVDDVSGWDFMFNDNDPYDDVRFGHGTGEARDSSAQTNDGVGDAGVCPECTVMALRVGDSFVVESSSFALAVVYATDNGVMVVQEALGAIDMSPLTQAALDYAYANNVTVVASAADENSFHANMPATANHATMVHAIVFDAGRWEDGTTFFQYNNCTNYGAQLMFSVPGAGCSSEATGKSSGIVGLIYSAALLADIPAPGAAAGDPTGSRRLTAEEVRQLLVHTVDTFYDPADLTDPTKYPTRDGWMRRFGYGRPNARTVVDAVLAGKLPPEVDLVRPLHFETLHADRAGKVTIDGRVGVRGAAQNPAGVTFDYVVEWAPGIDPTDDKFTRIGGAEGQTAAVSGPLAEWDLSAVTVDNPVPARGDATFQPDDPANRYLATIRVRATLHASDPRLNGLTAEGRRGVHVVRDRELLPGFPLYLGASGESSPKLADLDGDRRDELIVGDAGGYVHAFTAEGKELAGWPAHASLLPHLDGAGRKGASHATAPAFASGRVGKTVYSPVVATVAIGDVDGDGKLDVVAADWHGAVFAFHGDGSTLAGFPVAIDHDSAAAAKDADHRMEDGVFCAPALGDLDHDGKLDVVVAGMDGKVYAWNGSGKRLDGFPVVVQDPLLSDDRAAETPRQRARIMSSPALGDLNGDGRPEIVVGSNENYNSSGRLYAIDARGTGAPGGPFLPGFPTPIVTTHILPVVGEGLPNAPALADVDKDGVLDIVTAGVGGIPAVYNASGKPFGPALVNRRAKYGAASDARNEITLSLISNAAIADLDGDGDLDVLQGTAGGDAVLAFATSGKRRDFEHHVAAWKARTGELLPGFPRNIEDWQFFMNPIAADVDGDGDEELITGSAGYFVHAWNAAGKEAAGFPKFTGGWIAASAALGDLDGDGNLELAVGTRNGWLYAWHLAATTRHKVGWASFHHDNRNTGNYEEPTGVGARDLGSAGCGMTTHRPAPLGAMVFLFIGLALVRLRNAARRR